MTHPRLLRHTRVLAALASAGLANACSTPAAPRPPVDARLPDADHLQLIPAGDVSVATRRTPPGGGPPVLCVSPSPDYATALARGRSANGSGGVTGGPTASAGFSVNDAETIAQMQGRSNGVVALRDGLYQACQAYANGQIGRTAYALILSQYGTVLGQIVGTASPGAASPGAGQAQALLVACLNAYDPTLPAPAQAGAVLTPEVCRGLVQHVADKVSDLLATPPAAAPPAPAATAPASPVSGAKPKP